jgi:hypothetical protein
MKPITFELYGTKLHLTFGEIRRCLCAGQTVFMHRRYRRIHVVAGTKWFGYGRLIIEG